MGERVSVGVAVVRSVMVAVILLCILPSLASGRVRAAEIESRDGLGSPPLAARGAGWRGLGGPRQGHKKGAAGFQKELANFRGLGDNESRSNPVVSV